MVADELLELFALVLERNRFRPEQLPACEQRPRQRNHLNVQDNQHLHQPPRRRRRLRHPRHPRLHRLHGCTPLRGQVRGEAAQSPGAHREFGREQQETRK